MQSQVFILAVVLLVAGCASPGVRQLQQSTDLPRQQELADTPFFPQQLYQCGPAALATVLNTIDIPVQPDELTPQVYIPSRKGSLQLEMLAAARRNGAIAVKVAPNLEALLAEINAGHSVLVLQNLALSWYPVWHYAVAIGYDLDQKSILLRSGTTERMQMSLNTFEHTWARSQHWGFIALKPGQLPASSNPEPMAQALLAYEKTASSAKAQQAYAAAAKRWPDHLLILMGLGNSAYAANDIDTALQAFQQAVAAHPQSAAAHNNLANVLLAKGSYRQAQASAQQALEHAGEDAGLKALIMQTMREISAKQSAQNRN